MKTLFAIALLICVQVAFSQDLSFPQIVRKWAEQRVPYACECIKKTTVSPVTLDNWIHYGEFAKCGRLMCSIRYIYADLGIFKENGDIVKDKFIANTFLPADKAEKVYEKCKDIKGRTACNTVYLIDQCAYAEIKALTTA